VLMTILSERTGTKHRPEVIAWPHRTCGGPDRAGVRALRVRVHVERARHRFAPSAVRHHERVFGEDQDVDLGTSSNRSSPSRAPRHYRTKSVTRSCCRHEKGSRAQSLRTSATRAVWSPPARRRPSTATPTIRARRARELLSGTRCARIDASSPRGLCVLSQRGDGLLGVRARSPETDLTIGPYVNVSDSHASSSVTMVDPPGIEVCDRLSQRGEVVRFSHETRFSGRFRAPGESSRFRSKPPDLPAYFASRFAVRRGKGAKRASMTLTAAFRPVRFFWLLRRRFLAARFLRKECLRDPWGVAVAPRDAADSPASRSHDYAR